MYRGGNDSVEKRLAKCKKSPNYFALENIVDGILYYNGNRIDLAEFHNGKTVVLDTMNYDDTNTIDLLDF